MKIAVFYSLPFSGAKRTVFEQVKGLKRLGHSVDVYTINRVNDLFDPGQSADKNFDYTYSRITINFPFFRKFFADFSDFYILKNLQKRIAEDIDSREYNIILVQTDHFTQAPFILRFLKTKSVYICLEPLKIAYEYGLRISDNAPIFNKIYEYINRTMRKIIDRKNARAADYSLAISNFGRELMIQSFDLYPKVFYLGVDTNLFKKINIHKKNQVLFVGQKLDMNGYDKAIEAIKLIPTRIRPQLKVLSISKDPKNAISDKEIVKMYNESLITLSLSNYDTFGLVPLESMACEVPVVAFNVAAYRETIVDKETGFLVDFDPKEISEKLVYLLQDSKLREEMGKNGRDWVMSSWTWNKQILELDNLIKEFTFTH